MLWFFALQVLPELPNSRNRSTIKSSTPRLTSPMKNMGTDEISAGHNLVCKCSVLLHDLKNATDLSNKAIASQSALRNKML